MSDLLVGAPLRLEQIAIKLGGRQLRTRHTGMGQKRARAAAELIRVDPARAVVVMGVCGGLDEGCRPGDVVIAEELFDGERERAQGERAHRIACHSAEPLARALESRGVRVRRGPVVSVARIAHGDKRDELRERGAIAVDMESAWLAAGAAGRPFAVIRVVSDTPASEVTKPLQMLQGAGRAALSLRRTAATLEALVREKGMRAVLGDGAQSTSER